MIEFTFKDKHKFLAKLEDVLKIGFSPNKMKIIMPHPDHDVEHLMEKYVPKSKLKFFTLVGALIGCISGFALTGLTVWDWPLITGGKPLMSWPAFVVIAFELTILIGVLVSFGGFIFLARFPDFKRIISPENYGNEYILQMESEDKT